MGGTSDERSPQGSTSQDQIEALVAEVEHLRSRLADAPKRMRTLEERLLETKGQLSQAVARNEKLSYTLREARDHIATSGKRSTSSRSRRRRTESSSARTTTTPSTS